MSTQNANPILAPWTGPYGGIPPFDEVKVAHFEEALHCGMDEMKRELENIANQTEPATFDNTIAALEDSGRLLGRIYTSYGVFLSTMSSPEMRQVERTMAPTLAGMRDLLYGNAALFQRIEAVHNNADAAGLDSEQKRLTWKLWRDFSRNGAQLSADNKARLAALNQTLAGLYTQFGQNLLADEESVVLIDDASRLGGLPDAMVRSLAAAASSRGHDGKWAVVNSRSSVDPFLLYSEDRALREQVWRAFIGRGDHAGEHDNKPLITQILALRAERATLLGYETHAHWQLETSMAGEPAAAMRLMEEVWTAAVARAEEEVKAQQAIVDGSEDSFKIAPWDYRFYMEQVRQAKYDLDDNAIKPYLQLDKLRDGMFWMAQRLYSLTFTEVEGLPVVHTDVRVWEVTRDDAHVGLFYFDPYARPGKRSGAWMNAYRSQERFRGKVTPIVSNNCNFVKSTDGTPSLLSWDDAETLFHEFGHALHGLLSDVTYPMLAGTSVTRDYVEFPSQLHEHWLGTEEVLERFARHVETDEPIPDELVAKIRRAATFNSGFATVEYLGSALMDMKLHLAGAEHIEPGAFEKETLAALGMPEEIVMRHRTPQFAHIFSGDGYSAAYYSYLWADTLTADAAEAFKEAGSMFDEATAKRLHEHVLSAGNTVDPAEGFRAFRGRDVSTDALMRDRGFPVTARP